jgi:hypothetical protein
MNEYRIKTFTVSLWCNIWIYSIECKSFKLKEFFMVGH